MPVAEPAPTWVRVKMYGSTAGIGWANAFYYKPVGAVTFPEDAADLFLAEWTPAVVAAWLNAVSADTTLGTAYCEAVDDVNRFAAYDSIAESGEVSGAAVPAQDTAIIRWFWPRDGTNRRAPGRTNISGVPEDGFSGSQVSPAQELLLQALAEALRGPFTLSEVEFELSIFSPTHSTLKAVNDWLITPDARVLRHRRRQL